MKHTRIWIGALAVVATASLAEAADDTRHMHGHHMHGAMHETMQPMHENMGQASEGMQHTGRMFLVKRAVDGYTVSFHVMPKPNGQGHQFMIKVEKDGKVVRDLVVNSKVVHPNGASEQKMMRAMGDWFSADYDLGHAGAHQLMVLFKTPDGAKHFAGVWYPKKP